MKEHRIITCTMEGVWLKGIIDDYGFQAKVCDKRSVFGIDGGRVIKLHVEESRGDQPPKEMFSYERGWDKRPRRKDRGIAEALIRFLESMPKQEVWEKTFYRKLHHFLVTDDEILEYEEDNL